MLIPRASLLLGALGFFMIGLSLGWHIARMGGGTG